MCDFDIERIPAKSTPKTTNDSIKILSCSLTDAENEIARLREVNEKLREEYDKAIKKQHHLDYTVCNQQENLNNIGKTLELYEKENNALKVLLRMYL